MKLCLLVVAVAAASLLSACGGGGGSSGSSPAAVTGVTVATPSYGKSLLITVAGSNLDQGLTLASAGCKTMTLSTTAPNVSTASTAYYTCTVTATGAQSVSVTRTSDSAALTTATYTVPLPQVTFAVSNGAGVSGNLVITLEQAKTPVTVDNFLAYVNSGFYVGTVIHRNSPNFVLQGGGYAAPVVPTLTSTQLVATHKPTNAAIVLEDGAGLSNVKYTLAMARTAAADSATSEFFINLADNNVTATGRTNLDKTATSRGYAVFGTVTTGTDVVAAMAAAPCVAAAYLGAPECLPSPNLSITGAVQTR